MTKYNLEFLEEKLGPFQKESQYPTKPISGFNLIYIESKSKNELNETVREIKDEMNPGYVWGYVIETNAIYVTRAFGENKIFIYNPDFIKNKTDYVKGKLKVLNNLTSNNINDLFDQKAVFDYFYRKLWDLRLELGKEIRDKNNLSDNKSLMVAQHIIDRVIFTYFICEKDFITLNGEISLDSKTLFNSIAKMPDPWKCLKNLFFEQFAKKKSTSLLFGKNAQVITPYLNGGLFRPKIIENISEENLIIEYSREQWQKLFEPLNKYTWIIEDEIPDHKGEYEGNLTPEIIGHIYEKFVISMETLDEINLNDLNFSDKGDLRRGNKKIGAYYTPEYITEYISLKTIIPNLFQKLEIKKHDFDYFLNNSSTETLNKALNILDEMTICDPACGSGAFLIKTGEVLLELKTKILQALNNKKFSRYDLKKQIIINNLYGVDIQEGAIEICKLRLWLWLISSSVDQIVEPLPNIEYNFTVGNSLVGWTNEKLEQNVLVQIDEMIFVILDALKLRFNTILIEKIKENLKKTDMNSYANAMSMLKNIYSYSTEDEAENLKKIIETIKKVIYQEIDRIFYDFAKSKGTKISQNDYENLNPFHWKVDFNSVFKNGGFDIIIGNPPWGAKLDQKTKNYINSHYNALQYQINSYVVFMERSLGILKENGLMGFITPSTWLTMQYFSEIRKLLLNSNSLEIITLLKYHAFKGVTAESTILIVKRNIPELNHQITTAAVSDSYHFNNMKLNHIDPKFWRKNIDIGFNVFFNGIQTGLVTKIYERVKNPLKNEADVKAGIKPYEVGKGDPKQTREYVKQRIYDATEKIGPDYRQYTIGGNITRYNLSMDPHLWIKYGKWLAAPRKINFSDKKIIIRRTSDRIMAVVDYEGYINLNSVFNVYLKKDSILSYEYLMSILNSKLTDFIYRYLVPDFGRVFSEVKGVNLDKLPIFSANIEQQKPINSKAISILKLNKNRQNEISSFHMWLQQEFAIPKLSKKLKKYYILDNKTFIKEVQKKNLIAKTSDKEEILKNKFQNSLSIIKPLNADIEKLEAQIDEMIYKLYGLTDDEINVVEEMVGKL